MPHPHDLTIAALLAAHPNTRELFIRHGMQPLVTDEGLAKVGPYLRVSTALAQHRVDAETFWQEFDALDSATGPTGHIDLSDVEHEQGRLDFLALLPCPLRVPFEQQFDAFMATRPDLPPDFTYALEANANRQLSYYDYVTRFTSPDEIPDIVLSPGVNDFFSATFVRRFVDEGVFEDALVQPVHEDFATLGYADPTHRYTMLSMNLLIFVVDTKRLGERPLPRTWADLLDPVYERSIGIRGQHNPDGAPFYCETTLMNIHKEHGEAGIEQLAANVYGGYHPAEMIKKAGDNRDTGPAICVVPHFFANKVRHPERVQVVWPHDGAIVSPVFLLVKKSARTRLAPLVEFLTGPEVGQAFASANFPSLHADVDNRLPPGKAYKWIGWDYIWGDDVQERTQKLTEHFVKHYAGDAEPRT